MIGRRNRRMASMICALLTFLWIGSGCSKSADDQPFIIVYNDETGPQRQPIEANDSFPPVESRTYTVALVSKVSGIPYFNVAEEGAREAAEELGVELISTGPLIADAKHQIEVVEQLIEQGVDAIAIAANDPESLAPVMKKAQSRGIAVITWDSDAAPDARTFFVNQVDAESLGRHMMDLLALHMNESGPFAIMTGSATALNLNEWIRWALAQRDEYYPKMRLVETVANDEDPEKAYMQALGLLDRHPELEGALGIASISPPALAKAVQERGKTGQVKVVGVSTPNIMRPYIHSGVAPVITLWSPKKLGYLTIYLAKQLLEGQMPYDGQEIPNVGNIRFNGDVVIMGEPLDFKKDNVDEYDF